MADGQTTIVWFRDDLRIADHPALAAAPAAFARHLPKFIHQPWQASELELRSAGVALGSTYPRPIGDHAVARRRALDRYARLKKP